MLREFRQVDHVFSQLRTRPVGLIGLAGMLLVGLLTQAAGVAVASTGASRLGYSLTPSTTEPYAACPQPTPRHPQCLSIVVPPAAARARSASGLSSSGLSNGRLSPLSPFGSGLEGSGERGGFAPSDLLSAYRLPATGGSGQTVAIVDAYDDPKAEADLKTYREHYKLAACTEANGCFKKVNQTGETKNYPTGEPGWGEEISLDLDMVSAICPECHILLVEATNNESTKLDAAEDEAATLKATEISNSWGGPEESGETSEDNHFNHSGIPITVAAGDKGYGVSYPAASKYVIAVGGTTLYKTPFYERGWFEEAWYGTGSGCSAYELKESWQTKGCGEKGEKRVDNDVAAVASVESPVSVYDSYEESGWMLFGGTSVAAPIVAGVEALSSSTVRSEGAATFYKHPESLFDVTTGTNSLLKPCSPEYLCNAEIGYDGPTGNGTPDVKGGDKGLLGQWSTAAIPGPASHSGAVSCTSSSWCVEVGAQGEYGSAQGEYPAAESWNGTEWSPMGTGVARPSGRTRLALLGVSCTSSSACTAVGYDWGGPNTLGERWNGTEWLVQSTPNPGSQSNTLTSVSCTSATSCIAVGSSQNGSTHNSSTLAERWNGTEWSLMTTPNPTGTKSSGFSGVSCTSSSACTAVGGYDTESTPNRTLAESWNGTEWSIQSTPNPTGAEQISLNGVSCASSTACTAVGHYYSTGAKEGEALAERWNGTEWSLQTVANPTKSKSSFLTSVSCASSSSCEAVGFYYAKAFSTAGTPFAEHWNGTEWSVQEPPSSGASELKGVSCASSTACIATGSFFSRGYFPYGSLETNLAYSLSGTTWSLQPMPSTSASKAVSCASSTACTAVGSVTGEGQGPSEIWNGGAWSNLPAETPSGAVGFSLSGISCTSPGECTAVGSYANSTGTRVSLAERQNKVQSTPNPAEAKASSLRGVSCTSSKACTAVGSYTNSAGTEVTFAESWNGTEWSLQSPLNPAGAKATSLYGVSCTSSSACAAVGHYTNSSATTVTLAESWNGTAWSIQSTPNPSGATASSLKGVSCASSTACTAVGSYSNGAKVETLVESGNGSEWFIESTPNPTGATESILEGVSCTSTPLCMATGFTIGKNSLVTNLSEIIWGPVPAPAATTEPATGVTKTEATLHGSVNPTGQETTYHFEYGKTTAYGTSVPVPSANAGSGTSNLEQSKAITGLEPETTYHYRIVASNGGGTTYGADREFASLPNPPENTVLPVASPETPDQAVPESTTTGTWTHNPTGYEYQWERCNATGGECAAISGATSSKYTPVEADVGHTLVVKVTAKNSGGSNSAHSKATNKVKPAGEITEYALPKGSVPHEITQGPDGNLWYTDYETSKIGKITTSGTITEYALPTGSGPEGITQGPDGNLWYTDYKTQKIGKITTSGTITEYALPEKSWPHGITQGPDGNLWYTDTGTNKIGKITMSGAITEYALPRPKESSPSDITQGPDGNIWYTNSYEIGKITTSGAVTEYTLPAGSSSIGITQGPDGNLWYTAWVERSGKRTAAVGKITTSGTVTEYTLPENSLPSGVTQGPDGNIWYTDVATSKIGRITMSGTITEYALPKESWPRGITQGPDKNLWFANTGTSKIGNITP
jgi:streptogramin lyase